jgi:RNA polymerase sigma-70 factor (ECF subfamily)
MQKPDENPDHYFLQTAAQGDERSFGVLYERYLDEIYRYVYFKVGNKQTAEDITEETFIKTWESLSRIYRSDGQIDNLRAWLYRIARNLVIDFYRKNKAETIEGSTTPAIIQSPEETAIEQEETSRILSALQKLKPDFQQIVILRLINDLSHKEIASIIGISEAHSRILLYRALKKMKEIM